MKRVAIFVLPFIALLSVVAIAFVVSQARPMSLGRLVRSVEGGSEEAPE